MIESLNYYAGMGLKSGSMYPKDLSIPVEVDRLEVKTDNDEIAITVFNRGITLLMTEVEPAGRQTQELYLAGIFPCPGKASDCQAPDNRAVLCKSGVCMKTIVRAKASTTEERMRENRMSGTVPGAPGNRRPYGGGACVCTSDT